LSIIINYNLFNSLLINNLSLIPGHAIPSNRVGKVSPNSKYFFDFESSFDFAQYQL